MKLVKIFLQTTYWQENSIPVLISEGGNSKHGCSNYSQFAVDAMTVPFCGVAGYNQWEGWGKDQGDLRDITIRAQNHMNGVDVIGTLSEGGGYWGHYKQHIAPKDPTKKLKKVKPIEMQYYVSNDRKYAVGYIRNLTYNIFTMRFPLLDSDSMCFNSKFSHYPEFNTLNWFDFQSKYLKRKMRIKELLTNNRYRMEFYSFDEPDFGLGKWTATKYGRARSEWEFNVFNIQIHNPYSGLKLKFPSLDYDNPDTGPVLWFVISPKSSSELGQGDKHSTFEEIGVDSNKINSIYPNPGCGSFTVLGNSNQKIIVYSLEGREVYTNNIQEGENSIDLYDLDPGLYFVIFTKDRITLKFEKL